MSIHWRRSGASAMLRCLLTLLLLAAFTACHRTPSAPLPHRAYLWQRAWTPAVSAALSEAQPHLQGLVLLGAEAQVTGDHLEPQYASISWPAVADARQPISLALRVAPYGGTFAAEAPLTRSIAALAQELCAEARVHGVALSEFQLDFDCAQKKLPSYQYWVQAVRQAVAPVPLLITTLPAWLAEPSFPALVRAADGFVLQVHSVPLRESAQLCNPTQARAWVEQAARIRHPFWVALPTYRCLAGYAPGGRLLGVAMDAAQPSWPRGTHTLELASSARDLAALVHGWQADRPTHLQGILWYRLPVATDLRNWRWPTLAPVLAGRLPRRAFTAAATGDQPADLTLQNSGEADDPLHCQITATWSGPAPLAAEALPGWILTLHPDRAVFAPAPGARLRLPPGEKRAIGWLRHESRTPLQLTVADLSVAGAEP